jgi:hypothetical protein
MLVKLAIYTLLRPRIQELVEAWRPEFLKRAVRRSQCKCCVDGTEVAAAFKFLGL